MPGNVAGRNRTGSLGFHPMEWYMHAAYTGAKEFVSPAVSLSASATKRLPGVGPGMIQSRQRSVLRLTMRRMLSITPRRIFFLKLLDNLATHSDKPGYVCLPCRYVIVMV